MQNVNHCNSPCMGQPQNAVYDKLQQSSNLQLAAVNSERSADITIMTDDNDKVTLSLDSHIKAVALTYDEKTRTNSSYSESRAEMVGIEVERQMALSIEGDLNDQERKEIKQVLKSIFKMVRNFLSGKFGQGAGEAQKFDNLETISSVKAEFEAKDTAAYVSQSADREVTQAQVQAPMAIPQHPDARPVRPNAIKPQTFAPVKPEDNPQPTKAQAEAVADKMVEVVKDSGVDPAKIQKPVDDMFGRLMRKFLKEGPFNFRQMRRLRSVMQEFSQKMEKLTAPEKPEAVEPSVLQPVADQAVDQVKPMEVFTVKKSTVQTQVSIFEQSFSFSFEYSAAKSEETADDEVSVEV